MDLDALSLLEEGFLPLPDKIESNGNRIDLTFVDKVSFVAQRVLLIMAGVALIPLAILRSLGERAIALFSTPASEKPALPQHDLPKKMGFADSLFQTSGLGSKASATPLQGTSDWDAQLTPDRIEGTEDGNYHKFFTDVLGDPDPYIAILQEMGATAHRISLEPSVMQDPEAVRLYNNFFRKLQDAHIEPHVTLFHFVAPEGLQEENFVQEFTAYGLAMMREFQEITTWYTINEPGVLAFQSRIFGVYPPNVSGDFAATGRFLRTLLMAHTSLYKKAKEEFGDTKTIGITHQFLKFKPFNGNPIEQLFCYFLSKITHFTVYNFFKTGTFEFKIPGVANISWQAPQGPLADVIGVQHYGYPKFKFGFNEGKEYPGYKIQNSIWWKDHLGFTIGATCSPGGTMQSFGPGFNPEELRESLQDAAALAPRVPRVAITETGCDAMQQAHGEAGFSRKEAIQPVYYDRIVPILKEFELSAVFFWTLLRGHLEWNRGSAPCLGVVDITKNGERRITGWMLSPAAKRIQAIFSEIPRRMARAA